MIDEGEVDAVARALYRFEDCARGWDSEPEENKEAFRQEARVAIVALTLHRRENEVDGGATILQVVLPCLAWLPVFGGVIELI